MFPRRCGHALRHSSDAESPDRVVPASYGAQKIAQLRSLTSLVIGLSRRAIARENPHLNHHDVDMLWVELNYGQDLAQRLSKYVNKR